MEDNNQAITTNSSKTGWKTSDKNQLAQAILPLLETQKLYGKQVNVKLLMAGWEKKFAGRFSIEQIVYALDKYTDKKDDFPAPSDIVEILEPEQQKITHAEYQEALRKQKANNYPKFSYEESIINEYRGQRENANKGKRDEVELIKKLGNPLKAIK